MSGLPTSKSTMKCYVYILYSAEIDRYYIGSTDNMEVRLQKHIAGTTRFTSRTNDWKIVFIKECIDRANAIKEERRIKKMKSRKYIEKLINT